MRSLRPFAVLASLVLGLAPLLSGCGEDKPPAPEPPPVVVFQAKTAPIGQLQAPAQMIAWGGADNMEKLSTGAQAFLSQISPMIPSLLDAAKDQLRAKMALTRLDGIDWKRPARVALFDPKGMPKASVAIVVTLANKDQLIASLPAARKERDEGNALTYRDDLGRSICLNFIDEAMVVTWDKKQFEPNRETFAALARATVPEEQAFFLSAKNVATLYAKDIDEMLVQAKQQILASPFAMPGAQGEVQQRVFTWMVTTFKELDRIEALPRLVDDGVLLDLKLHPRADSALEKSFKAIEPRPHTLLAKLPADAPMFASFSTNPDAVDGLTTRLVEWAMSVGYGGNVPEEYAHVMKDYFQATAGEMAVAVHKPLAGDGLSLTTLLSVRDEAKLREAMRKSKDAFKDKDTIETFKKTGITVEYKQNSYKLGPVPVDTVDVKYDKGKSALTQLGPFGDAMGDFWNYHMAVSKDLGIIGYGKEARKTLEAFLGGKVTGGLDKAAGPVRAFKFAVKDPVGIFYISPVEMAKRASLGGKNPVAESLKDLAGTTGVVLSFSAKDGVLELMVDVPTEQARNVAQGMARARAVLPQ